MEDVSTPQQSSVLSVGLKFGIIASLLQVVVIMVKVALGQNPYESTFDAFAVVGILLALALVALAHIDFKKNGDGFMSFGQGLGIGMIMTLVSLVVMIIFTYVYLNYADPTAWTAVVDKAKEDMAKRGSSESDIKNAESMIGLFFWVFFVVFSLFFGFVYALLVTIFTHKRRPETF